MPAKHGALRVVGDGAPKAVPSPRQADHDVAATGDSGGWVRPRVLIHYAQTLDGRIAAKNGSSQWISGKDSLRFAHELRAGHDAVLVGVGTALRDNPRLTVRHAPGRDPLKVVVDSRLRTPSSAALLAETPDRTIFLTTAAAGADDLERVQRLGARVLIVRADPAGWVDLPAGLAQLRALGVRSLMVEGGARVITSLLRGHLADRLVVCVAPIVLGRGVEAVGDLGIAQLGKALGLGGVHIRRLGEDFIISGELMLERSSGEAEGDSAAAPRPVLAASAALPTRHGTFELRVFEVNGVEHPALVLGDVAAADLPLVRVHSECLTGEAFGSLRCDCGEQLDEGLAMIAAERCGCLLYLRQEGRGIGLANKVRAYRLQDSGLDTVDANLALGLPADGRDYAAAAAVLRELGIARVRLITNNPAKIVGLEAQGLTVAARIPLHPTLNPTNTPYLRTKVAKMGHLLSLALD